MDGHILAIIPTSCHVSLDTLLMWLQQPAGLATEAECNVSIVHLAPVQSIMRALSGHVLLTRTRRICPAASRRRDRQLR